MTCAKCGKSCACTLTTREDEVFRLLGSGEDIIEMAARLCISPKTIELHLMHIRQKLALRNGRELLVHAVREAVKQEYLKVATEA